jgi:uncharacterized protein (TIGR03437 family)
VSFNGVPAPIIYVSSSQVAVLAPYELDGAESAYVAVGYNGQASGVGVPVAATAPGVFTANSTGVGQAAAVNADGTINGATHPVPLGGTISLYVTGEGTTSPGGVTGAITGNSPPVPNAAVNVTIGGQAATTTYVGEAPQEIAGLLQINVQIPSNIAPSTAVPVTVSIGGVNSQNFVTIAVSQ